MAFRAFRKVAAVVASAAFNKQRYDTYKGLVGGNLDVTDATKQNTLGVFNLGLNFARLPIRAAVAGGRTSMAPKGERGGTLVKEVLSTASSVDLATVARMVDSIPGMKEKVGGPIMDVALERGYQHVKSTGQAAQALFHEERRGNRVGALDLLRTIDDL